jgi:YD repeat-containing protein
MATSYDRDGEVLDVTDPTGAHTQATFDDLGRQITQSRSERTGGQVDVIEHPLYGLLQHPP